MALLDKAPAASPSAPKSDSEKQRAIPTDSHGRTVTARYPHHVWNIDLTVVPTATGLWIPFFPGSIMQRWPFAWWVLVVVDPLSRSVVGFDLFRKQPSADEVCSSLDRIVSAASCAPKYTVTDQGPQFGDAFRAWCTSHHVRPRFGAIGKHGSIAVTERLILSLKNEALRRILVPLRAAEMHLELERYALWYNEYRPHSALQGATPGEVLRALRPAIRKPRFEPRARYPATAPTAAPQTRVRGKPGVVVSLVVSHVDGAEHLPIVKIRRAA